MKTMILAGFLAAGAATSANAATIYGVDELNNLIGYNSAAPGTATSSVAITGIGDSIKAIDFRPGNRQLYALGSNNIIYTVNLTTGVATAASGVLALTGTEFAFDFNPTIDRLRIVSNSNDNYVFNPNDGALTTATPVFYAGGDVNAGRNPDVTAAAYTQSLSGPTATTQLYSIDTTRGVLTRQANSAGTLVTVGALGTPLGSRTSFDILGNDAFVSNGTRLFSINLNTGALTRVGTTQDALFGLAIAPVPEPATWATMILGVGMAGGALRRRRAVKTAVSFG